METERDDTGGMRRRGLLRGASRRGGGIASYVFEVVYESGQRQIEVFVAIALQHRELEMFRESP